MDYKKIAYDNLSIEYKDDISVNWRHIYLMRALVYALLLIASNLNNIAHEIRRKN